MEKISSSLSSLFGSRGGGGDSVIYLHFQSYCKNHSVYHVYAGVAEATCYASS